MVNAQPRIARVPFDGPLHAARFVARPNRFVLRCRLARTGGCVTAHLADPGRLRELLLPERKLWLREHAATSASHRRTRWSAALVQTPDGEGLVSLDTTLPNRLVARALAIGALPGLAGWSLERPEVQIGHSRFDFLLRRSAPGTGRDARWLALEVKSVTLAEDGVGLFPDAVTARGARHLRELAALARQRDWSAAVLFVVQRADVGSVMAATHLDPTFAQALAAARDVGVQLLAQRCSVSVRAVALAASVPVAWERVAEPGVERSRREDPDRRVNEL